MDEKLHLTLVAYVTRNGLGQTWGLKYKLVDWILTAIVRQILMSSVLMIERKHSL